MATQKPTDAQLPPPAPGEGETASHLPFPIIGVGASAGGLEAFIELLEAMPADPGMSFLFVQHLQPRHDSQLVSILSRVTGLRVRQAEEGIKVEPNHVFVIPPAKTLTLEDGHLHLSERPPHGPNMPADYLFRSLAHVQRSRSIGVILSGGGTDGTLGFQAIKAEGGITFAQDEKSARQESMPRSAINDGCVDYVLRPSLIASELVRIAGHPFLQPSVRSVSQPHDVGGHVEQIIALLRGRMDVDFTHYKRTTINRRIHRRMALRGIDRPEEYVRMLRSDPGELHALYQDFLIRVTQFFRDPEAFEVLSKRVFPSFLVNRLPDQPIRIWVAGCASGEEVYSIAIALMETLGGRAGSIPIKILATDLNEAALERARAGVYVDNIELDVSAERLRRFFVRNPGQYQINKSIRDLCVFSGHNMTSDPPFSHIDLVSCRNVLIYMDAALQKRVLPILHYALNPEGVLFLGSSESLGQSHDLFTAIDAKARLFRKKGSRGTAPLEIGAYLPRDAAGRRSGRDDSGPLWHALDVQREADRIVLARYAPVGVIIDEAMIVLQFRGRTSAYLEPAPGMASLDLLRMLHEGLLAEVRSAITQARNENSPAIRRDIRFGDPKQPRNTTVEVIPFKVPPAGVRFFLVLFTEAEPGAAAEAPPAELPAVPQDHQVAQLQQELGALREYLQSVIEDQERTNEELKSANEEILSANEELQSTNEELQTAKEEAQSANEELATVNEELNHRNAELSRVNNDVVNLLSGVNIAIVMVGRDLRIRRFTPLAEKLFNLIPSDMGRPISDIRPNLAETDLPELIRRVIDTLAPDELEVRDKEGRWYALQIRPYVTLDKHIDGASIVLLDIDSLKRAAQS